MLNDKIPVSISQKVGGHDVCYKRTECVGKTVEYFPFNKELYL